MILHSCACEYSEIKTDFRTFPLVSALKNRLMLETKPRENRSTPRPQSELSAKVRVAKLNELRAESTAC